MAEMSFGRAMSWLADRNPDAPVLVFEGTAVTRSELERRSNHAVGASVQAVRAVDPTAQGVRFPLGWVPGGSP